MDEVNRVKPRPFLRVAMFVTVVLTALAAVGALLALVVLHSVIAGSASPQRFDHSVWLAQKGPREAMLTDLLTHTICPGTAYRHVVALLGPPDDTLTYPKGSLPNIEYDVGDVGMFYVDFRRSARGYVVYQVSPPPSADAFPDTGCWW